MTSPEAAAGSRDAIAERARDYFERRRFGEWGEADQAELSAWLAESFLHRAAFLRLEGAASYMEHLAAVHTFHVAGHVAGRAAGAPIPPAKRQWARWFIFPALAAASVAVIALWGAPFAAAVIASWLAPPDRVDSTDVGGRTLLSFADQTQIELDTNTTVRTRMTTGERTVWLEKGEAWFHVAHDTAHPFTVIVGKHRIVDLGTEFLVRRGADAVDVTLLAGRASLSADGAQTATLTPGEEAVATSASLLVTRRTPQEIADELAWRRGVLVFRNAPLAQVVREFNRYNATKLVIADPSIAELRFSAELQPNDYGAFLAFAQMRLKLRADRDGNSILISRDQKTKQAARTKRGR